MLDGIKAEPPVEGFVLNTCGSLATQSEVDTFFGSGSLSNSNNHRNMRFISLHGILVMVDNIATIETEFHTNF